MSNSHTLISDELTVDCLPGGVSSSLGRACHMLALSHDCHMSLDDPLWSQLSEFTVPELEVQFCPIHC